MRPAAALYPFRSGRYRRRKTSFARIRYADNELSIQGYAAEVIRSIEGAGSNPWVLPGGKTVFRLGRLCLRPLVASSLEGCPGPHRWYVQEKSFPQEPAQRVLLPSDCHWWAETPFCRFDSAGEGGGQTALLYEGISIFPLRGRQQARRVRRAAEKRQCREGGFRRCESFAAKEPYRVPKIASRIRIREGMLYP